MNKYEKAYNLLKKYTGYESDCIKELVERATPKKILYCNDNVHYFDCPNCNTSISYNGDVKDHKYCLNCGQALNWEQD